MEECGELVAAAAKNDPDDCITTDHLAEEMADVRIMIKQVEYLLDIQEAVQEYIDKKTDRQIRRMREAGMI